MLKKFKKLLAGIGIGAALMLGAVATASASEGELEGAVLPEAAEEIVLEEHPVAEGREIPTPPTNNIKMTDSSLTSLSFKWGAASGADGYRVYIGGYNQSLDESKYLGITRSPKCKIAKLLPNTPYTIRIRSVKLNSKNQVIDQSKVIRFNSITKEAKVNRVSSNKDGLFTIRMYNPSPSNKSDDILGYRVRYENVATHAKSTHYYNKSRTGFRYKPKANYFYKLTITPYITTVKNGQTTRSYAQKSITHYIAQQPRLSKKSHTNTSQTIGWKKVQGATSYTVLVKYPGTKEYKKVARTKGLSYTLSNMKRGQSYLIKVVAQRGRFLSTDSIYYRVKL